MYKGAFHAAMWVLMSLPTNISISLWVVDTDSKSLLVHGFVIWQGNSQVFQRSPRWISILVGSMYVFTQFFDHPQHMNTRTIMWISNFAWQLHLAWLVKSFIKAVKLMFLLQRNTKIGLPWRSIFWENISSWKLVIHKVSFPCKL